MGEVKRDFYKGKARETHFLNCVKSAILCNLWEMKTKVRRTKVHIYIYIYIHVYEGKALAYASKTHTHQLKRESYSCDSRSLSSGAICWTNLVSFFFFTGAANLNFSLSLVFFPIFILIVLRGVVAPLFLLMRQVREVFYFRLFSLGFHSKYG